MKKIIVNSLGMLLITSSVLESTRFKVSARQIALCDAVRREILDETGDPILADKARKQMYNTFYQSLDGFKNYKKHNYKKHNKKNISNSNQALDHNLVVPFLDYEDNILQHSSYTHDNRYLQIDMPETDFDMNFDGELFDK